jgi:ribosomal protein S12 methylthiotransferase accessory factor YcaO
MIEAKPAADLDWLSESEGGPRRALLSHDRGTMTANYVHFELSDLRAMVSTLDVILSGADTAVDSEQRTANSRIEPGFCVHPARWE